jgi:O-antigen/teichoic acid export membrane protein
MEKEGGTSKFVLSKNFKKMNFSTSRNFFVKNFSANLVAQFIPPLLSFVLVPFYLFYLGVDAVGLIAFLYAIAAALNIFTKGINWSFQREVSQRFGKDIDGFAIPNLIHSFEVTFWMFGFMLGLCIAINSGFIANNLIQSEALSSSVIATCIVLVSVRIAITFPASVYGGFLIGVDRQALNSAIVASMCLVGSLLSIVAVVLSKSVIAFFVTELLGASLGMLIQRYWVYKILNQQYISKPQFDWIELKKMLQDSKHLIGINGIGVAIKTVDRIILGLVLPLSSVAIYNIGRMAGELLSIIYGSYLSTIFPNMCRSIVNEKDVIPGIIINTKIIWPLMLAVLTPIVIVSKDVLTIWTQQPGLAAEAADVLSIFVFGSLFLSLNNVLYQTLVALRKTRQSLMFNLIAFFIMIPSIYFLASFFGVIGVAWVWVAYGVAGWAFSFILMAPLFSREQNFEYFRVIILAAIFSAVLAAGQYFINTYFLSEYLWMRITLACIFFPLIALLTMLVSFGAGGLRNLLAAIK